MAKSKKPKTPNKPPPQWRRGGRPRGLAEIVERTALRPLAKQRTAQRELMTRWPAIVGEALARHTAPDKLTPARTKGHGATLRVRAISSVAIELQHREPQILERINQHFGYTAVTRLTIVQGPLPQTRRRQGHRLPRVSPDQEKAAAAAVAGIADDDLAAALTGLGQRVMAGSGPRRG
jgi:hypothetical protein